MSHDEHQEGGGAAEGQGQVEYTWERVTKSKVNVMARLGDTLVHANAFDLNNATARAKFAAALAQKLAAGYQVTLAVEDVEEALLGLIEQEAQADDEPEPTQAGSDAQVLVALGEEAELFHTADGKPYATVSLNGHLESFPLKSLNFKQYLVRAFRQAKGRPPGTDALGQAQLALEAHAQLDGPTREVHLRVAAVVEGDDPDDPTVYIDLCDPDRRVVRVTRHGWSVITNPPVRFRRPRGMHPLPVPQTGGSLAELRQFVNLPGKRRWRRFLAWLVKAFFPLGPDPILAISGVQGSAKSTLARVARLLIDPHEVIDRSIPTDLRDLMIAANGSAVMSFDNVSHLPDWFADALCRLATGAAFATRELYSDADEVHFRAKRPVILNGIPDLVSQGDVLDRTLLEDLPAIPKSQRKTEKAFWAEFDERRPRLLGALLDCLAGALQILPTLPESGLPRMADFALFGEAVCRAAGEPAGAFGKSLRSNRREAAEIALDSSVLAGPIQALVTPENPVWEGEAQALMNLLPALADEQGSGGGRGRNWPQSPKGMAGALRRLAPSLGVFGITVKFHRGKDHAKRRLITITRVAPSVG